MNRYQFIEVKKHHHAVSQLCRVLEVSRAAYCHWKACPISPQTAANLLLLNHIKRAHTDSNGTYGSPRIQTE